MDLRFTEGFHRLSRTERLNRLQKLCGLTQEESALLSGEQLPDFELIQHLIENGIGYFSLPMGIATHFVIDGRPVLVPMAVEETSVIAAASATAKWICKTGVIQTHSQGHSIIGQIQIPQVKDLEKTRRVLEEHKERWIQIANACIPGLVARGGGVHAIQIRELFRPAHDGVMLVMHVLCDPCDAMGANLINQVCEALKPHVEEWTSEKVGLCILSNLVDTQLVIAEVTLPHIDFQLGHRIEEASLFAQVDPYRAATHNKGILNGIDPILIATGNDWRAVEAGIHAYAAKAGRYQSVSQWKMDGHTLRGRLEIPLAVGTQGGVTRIHPAARVALKILNVTHSDELARICAAVGLVQNLGALKALSTVGIVTGHMRLHAANLAIAAGAQHHEIAPVREQLVQLLQIEKKMNLSRAQEILETIRLGAQVHQDE